MESDDAGSPPVVGAGVSRETVRMKVPSEVSLSQKERIARKRHALALSTSHGHTRHRTSDDVNNRILDRNFCVRSGSDRISSTSSPTSVPRSFTPLGTAADMKNQEVDPGFCLRSGIDRISSASPARVLRRRTRRRAAADGDNQIMEPDFCLRSVGPYFLCFSGQGRERPHSA